jgi:methylthioribose-1-phosphate isomerase
LPSSPSATASLSTSPRLSTFDLKIPDGSHIPIEERPAAEVTGYRGTRWAPKACRAQPLLTTPAELVMIIVRRARFSALPESIAALLK